MQASSILQRVQDILQDTTGVRWPEEELIRYLNDAQREVVLHKPDASADNRVISCVEGTRQTIPADGLRLLDVVRNMGADGSTPGNAVTLLGRGVLDAQRRGWHTETPSDSVDHFLYDPRDPKTFYVYPPMQSPVSQIEVILSVSPTDATDGTSELSLDPIYSNVLIDYTLYRAYSKDADFAANLERALTHYEAFAQSLGIKTQANLAYAPRAAQRDTRDAPAFTPTQQGG